MVHLGKTVRGNEVYIKDRGRGRQGRAHGGICYHVFAGFGGGRKSIAPGVAGFSTIEQNHQNCFSRDVKYEVEPKCNSGILEGNPVSEEMFEIAGW